MLDLVVRNGLVADGTGAHPRRADVGVRDGVVEIVGELPTAAAARELEATGCVVAPGFIDIHSHSDFTLLIDPRAVSSITQGVTTEAIGNCGHGCAPITDPQRFAGNIYGYRPDFEVDWKTTAGYLQVLDEAAPAVNVVPLTPNGNLRLAVMDDVESAADAEQAGRMAGLLEESLEAGAWGLSSGLEYPPERHTSEQDLVSLCRSVARSGGIYAAHTRNRERLAVEAVEEAIRTATVADVRLQVSHIIPRRGGPPDSLERCIEAVEAAERRGLDIAFDSHTRLHGITNLSAALPQRTYDGGPARLRDALSLPDTRNTIRRHASIISSFGMGGWDRVTLFLNPVAPELEGKSFDELAPRGGDGWDTVCDLLAAAAENPHAPLVICHSYDEEQVVSTMRHRLCMPASDATALCPDGPLAGEQFLGAYSWAGWFFSRVTRGSNALSLEETVHRLTGWPAERLGLRGRGEIAHGNAADLVVFDRASFRETATLAEPNRPCDGVRHVVVNGVVAMADGLLTGERGGRVLRRR